MCEEVRRSSIIIFYLSLFICLSAFGTGRLSWWGLIVGPSLSRRWQVFIVALSCFIPTAPWNSHLSLALERKSKVYIVRWFSE